MTMQGSSGSGQFVNSGGGSGGGGGAGSSQLSVAMADMNQTLSLVQINASAVFVATGALTADRTITIPAPTGASNPDTTAYQRTFRNNTTGGHNIIISTGSGTTVTIPPPPPPGNSVLLDVDSTGVQEAVTGI